MKNARLTPRPRSRKANALRLREALSSGVARPLPELTPRQKAISKLLGGHAIERFTGEQLRQGTERGLQDIKAVFDRDPDSEFRNFHLTNRLRLGQPSANAGLPSTRVRLHEVGGKSPLVSVLTFFSPPESELPVGMEDTLLQDPAFRITEEGISASLRTDRDPITQPYEALSRREQMLAYLITTDVAETMRAAQQAGSLAIE